MDPSFSNGGGGGGGGGGDGVSVSKYSISMNTFLWYFFQTLTLSSMLLMVLSIYWAAFSSGNNSIRVVCVISVAFSIISPSFIIPKLPQIAAVAIPIIQLNKKYFFIRLLNITVWMFFGYVYPFPAILLCYSLMAGVGLLKLYGNVEGPTSLQFVSMIGADAAGTSLYIFDYEIKHGTGRWVDSLTGWALLGLFAVTMLVYYLPPLVKPEKKKMMNDIEAIWTQVTASEKKKKKVNVAEAPTPGGSGTKVHVDNVVNVDHVVNVAEAPILGSGTKSLLETV